MQIEVIEQETYGLGAVESTFEFESKVNRELMMYSEAKIEVLGVDFVVQNNRLKAFIKLNK